MGKLIFYIDDEETLGDIGKRVILNKLNDVEVKLFVLATEALNEFKNNTPDLIITDYNRSSDPLSTPDFLKTIRMDSRSKKPKVLLVSAREDISEIEDLIDGWIQKPIQIGDLIATIGRFLGVEKRV